MQQKNRSIEEKNAEVIKLLNGALKKIEGEILILVTSGYPSAECTEELIDAQTYISTAIQLLK